MIVRELVTKLGFKVDEASIRRYNEDIGAAKQLTGELVGNLQDLARSATRAGFILTATLTTSITAFGVWSVKAAAQVEQLQIAYTTLIGTAEGAQKFIQETLEFAAKTPFEFEQISTYGKRLLAARIETEKIIPTMSMMGDIAALVGMEKLPQMVRALVDVKNKTKLQGQEIRQFTEAGVALIPLLAESMGKTTAEVTKLSEKGVISYDMVVAALKKATSEGGTFHRGMAAQIGTLGQLWSNLGDAVFLFRMRFGDMIVEVLPIRQFLAWLIEAVGTFGAWLEKAPKLLKWLIVGFGLLLAAIGPLLLIVGSLGQAFFALWAIGQAVSMLFGITLVAAIGKLFAFLLPKLLLLIAIGAAIFVVWQFIQSIIDALDPTRASAILQFWQALRDTFSDINLLLKTMKELLKDLVPFKIDPAILAARNKVLRGGVPGVSPAGESPSKDIRTLLEATTRGMAGAVPIIVPESRVTNHITMEVPAGTPEEQQRALSESVDRLFEEHSQRMLRQVGRGSR